MSDDLKKSCFILKEALRSVLPEEIGVETGVLPEEETEEGLCPERGMVRIGTYVFAVETFLKAIDTPQYSMHVVRGLMEDLAEQLERAAVEVRERVNG